MSIDFFGKDFNFEKYINERLLDISDENVRVEMRELLKNTLIPFYNHTEESYNSFVERYKTSIESSMGTCDVITGLMKRDKVDLTNHDFVPMIAEDSQKDIISAHQMINELEQNNPYKIMSVFMKIEYDKIKKLEQEERKFKGTIYTDYSEYPIKVVLKKNKRYFDIIRKLYKIFEVNNIRWKTICAPYLEKIFDVYVIEAECPDDEEIIKIDVDFEEFSDEILYDYIPMWNIHVGKERTGIYPQLSVDRVNYDHIIYSTRFKQEKDYLVYSDETKIWNVYKSNEDMHILCDCNEPIVWDILEFSYVPYEMELDMPIFSNKDEYEIKDVDIHTIAEVKKYISALGYDNILKLKKANVMKIKRQDTFKNTYSMDAFIEDEIRTSFTRQVLKLVFEKVSDSSCFDLDIMSYIVSRIQWKLPEFNCIGEFE